MQITRRFEFDAGHRIPNHESRCRHLHGHRYALEVTLIGEPVPEAGRSDEGMVLDFSALKALVHETVSILGITPSSCIATTPWCARSSSASRTIERSCSTPFPPPKTSRASPMSSCPSACTSPMAIGCDCAGCASTRRPTVGRITPTTERLLAKPRPLGIIAASRPEKGDGRLEHPLPDAAAWIRFFAERADKVPILRHTKRRLEELRPAAERSMPTSSRRWCCRIHSSRCG